MGSSLVTGLVAGLAGGLMMNLFARATVGIRGREARDASPGRDRGGRGMQPPQALTVADDDAAVRVGSLVRGAVADRTLTRRERREAGVAAHYGFSASVGVAYAMMRARWPGVSACRGTLYGAAVWIVADEVITPGLGLARPRRTQSRELQAYTLLGHLIYGWTIEAVLTAVSTAPQSGRARPSRYLRPRADC